MEKWMKKEFFSTEVVSTSGRLLAHSLAMSCGCKAPEFQPSVSSLFLDHSFISKDR